jgi:ABC-type Fe3+-hydroxamate transport system substrate-binding protein
MTAHMDARGSKLTDFKQHFKRIVSLVPSQTELLHALGLQEEVIGITKFCVHPEHWFRSKTRVGGTKNVNIEKIKFLQPGLILANKEENVKEQVEALAAEFPVWVTDVNSLNDALEMIETIGILTCKHEEALALKIQIEQNFKQLKQNNKPLRVCYLIWKDPYMTIGGDTFINDMLQHAGFENIFAAEKRYPTITIEDIKQLHCDVLLLSSEPFPFTEKHINSLQPLLPETKIMLADGELFSWYGSRLLHAPSYFQTLHAQLQMG